MAMNSEARKRMAIEDIDLIDQYTAGWNNAYAAGDTAGMNKYHQLAEGVRSKYNYSGGDDGSQYNVLKATQQSSGRSTVRTTPQSTGSFSYASMPQYVDGYQKLIDTAQQKVLNREPFSYDAEKDDAYKLYRDSYTRQGNKAMQDTLAEISARTGGLASSYAGQAAQQTYDGYMSALADKIPELREIAYQKYLDEYNMDKDALNMLTGLSDREYGRYRDSRSDYDTDKKFAYETHIDDRDYAYKLGRDAISDSRYENEWEYQREQDAYNREWNEDERRYNREQDALDRDAAAQRLAASSGRSGSSGGSKTEVAMPEDIYDEIRGMSEPQAYQYLTQTLGLSRTEANDYIGFMQSNVKAISNRASQMLKDSTDPVEVVQWLYNNASDANIDELIMSLGLEDAEQRWLKTMGRPQRDPAVYVRRGNWQTDSNI